ncbi:hypothetical protein GCM10009738_89210 [Kitasatospora viridis]
MGRLPALHAHLGVPGGRLLRYEQLPVGRDRGLLLDLLNHADGPTGELHQYMRALTRAYRNAVGDTARLARLGGLVRKLYWDRARPGGRLDDHYRTNDFPFAGVVPISDLATHTLHVNGRLLQLDWDATLTWPHLPRAASRCSHPAQRRSGGSLRGSGTRPLAVHRNLRTRAGRQRLKPRSAPRSADNGLSQASIPPPSLRRPCSTHGPRSIGPRRTDERRTLGCG